MTSDSPRMTAAAIDIGSNSIKMTVGRANGQGTFEQLDWATEVVRLGHDLDRTGALAQDRIEKAVETLSRFAARARDLGAGRIVAVATEATRAATNGAPFLDRVRQETGIDVRVVDGQTEALLAFRGLAADTDLAGTVVVADIGGASTELIFARDGVMQSSQSFPIGSGRLTDRLVVADPPTAGELAACEAAADEAFQGSLPRDVSLDTASRLIVLGGTGEFMARLAGDNQQIDLPEVRRVLAQLTKLSAAALAAGIGIPEARARVLPAGIAIVAAIASRIHPQRIEVSRSGVRTGLLLDILIGNGAETATDPKPPGRPADSPRRGRGKTTAEAEPQNGNFRETMKRRIAERWRSVWEAIPIALEGSDIEGVHDVRVASRRLRAAMDVAAPAFPGSWFKRLHRIAKEITGALGEVRDRDVLLEALRADREMAPLAEQPGIDRLIDRIERERAAARVDMERYLRQLLDGPLQAEIDRRFGGAEAPAKGSETPVGTAR